MAPSRSFGIVVVLMVVLLALPVPPGAVGAGGTAVRGSILIEGNAGFLAPDSGVRAGHGTVDDPYVISDWTLLADAPYGIRLRDTTAHVVVERVVVAAQAHGTCLLVCPETTAFQVWNASNVTLRDVETRRATVGIAIADSTDVMVDGALLGVPDPVAPADDLVRIASVIDGVWVSHAARVVLDAVHVRAYGSPARLSAATDVTVSDSSFAMPRHWPMPFDLQPNVWDARGVRGLQVTGSVFDNVYLRLQDARDVRVAGSEFHGGEHGITVGATKGLDVCGSVFEGLHGYAFRAWSDVAWINLTDSTWTRNGVAVDSSASHVTMERNLVTASHHLGVSLARSHDVVRHNVFVDNPGGHEFAPHTDVTGNWWGDASGPSGDGPGTGDAIRGTTAYDPWLTEPPAGVPDPGRCG